MALAKKVILSAGHGNGDPGAIGQGTTEANETVQITNRVAAYLNKWGFPQVVIMPHDVGDLVAEINWANRNAGSLEAALAVQIHKNSGGGNGSEVWTPSYPDDTSKDMARKVAAAIAARTGEPNRGVKEAQNNRWGRLGWCDDTNCYAFLVEAGFIDVNSNDDTNDDRYAYGIAKGIMDIYGLGIPADKVLATVDQVKAVYREVLERDADASGISTYANTKFTVEEVRADLLNSDEYKTLQANKVKFTLVSGTRVDGKEFTFIKDASLLVFPEGTRANVTGKIDYKVGEKIQFADRLLFKNPKGETREYYRTAFWSGKGVNNGFEAGSLKDTTPIPEPPVVTPPAPSKDDEQDKRLSGIEALLTKVVEFLQSIFSGFKK